MNKIVLLILGITLLVDLTVQNCSDPGTCVYSDEGCDPETPPGQCCRQIAQVAALAAASARASALALVSAHACAHACTGAEAHVTAAAAASAQVCITQAVCLSINTGKCCEVSTSIAANATSYASASASASASAWANARAAANAAASASAASSAAASLHATASALIRSSCCHFNLRVNAIVEAIGNFSVQSQVAVDAAVAVASRAEAAAQVAINASNAIQNGTSVMLSAGINNCCVANRTQQLAQASASAVYSILTPALDLFEFTNDAFDAIETGVTDYNEIIDPVDLHTLLCVAECKDAFLTCSDCCGGVPADSVCLAADVYILVAMETKALADALAGALAYALTAASARAEAEIALSLVANQVVQASLITDVNVKSCCSIVVTVSQSAAGIATAVAGAIASAQSLGQAYAASYSSAAAVATALSSANASSLATAQLNYAGCCGQACASDAPCCAIANEIDDDIAGDIASQVAGNYTEAVDEAIHLSPAFDALNKADSATVIQVASTQTAFLLQCCCCTKPPTTTTTKRLSFSSSGFTFKSVTTTTTTTTTTPPTTTSTLAPSIVQNCPSGQSQYIESYVPKSNYLNYGYQVVYNVTYATNTVTSDLTAIYNTCNSSSIICVGGYDSQNSSILISVACGNCRNILGSYTALDTPKLDSGVYWYFTPDYSFGYAPSSIIKQTQADTYETNFFGGAAVVVDCPQRVSWHVDRNTGGWRLGNIYYLNTDTRYYKIVFKK